MEFRKPVIIAAGIAIVAAIAAGLWWQNRDGAVPDGFATGNGRLEAEEIDIATKNPGRIQAVLVDEGDRVAAGQVLARMDTRKLEADLAHADAQIRRSRQLKLSAAAERDRARSDLSYARQEYKRALFLVQKGHVSKELLDRRRTGEEKANAALAAAEAMLADAEASIAAAEAAAEGIRADIDDGVLKAPRAGRIQYRIAEPGEVLPAGGKLLTLIDLSDMYMVFFLGARDAGRASIGAEARIVLDAFPDTPVAAGITYVSPEAQFTPKQVEVREERQKLVFRMRATVKGESPAALKPGMPGVAWVRLDPAAAWPAALK